MSKYNAVRTNATLKPGVYPAEIVSCAIKPARNQFKTPQHNTVMKSLDGERPGFITLYTNEVGYVKNSKGKVELDGDGNPQISKEGTEAALSIFGNFAATAGLEGAFDLNDLEGQTVCIVVTEEDNTQGGTFLKVSAYYPIEEYENVLEAQAAMQIEE